jgi:hypothetical protein
MVPCSRFSHPLPLLAGILALSAVSLPAGSVSALPVVATGPTDPGPSRTASSCESPQGRQFDFWLGDWEVRTEDGRLAGHNTIRKILNGCVLHESYHTPDGYAGESFNVYDEHRDVWHQTWVDVTGLLLVLEGKYRDGKMTLQGETGPPGERTLHRITWSLVDGDPDRVRQHWESSDDGGESWDTLFLGLYVRQAQAASQGR